MEVGDSINIDGKDVKVVSHHTILSGDMVWLNLADASKQKGEMSDAKGYHKSLFTAMNADQVAQHFYEQGKADALKNSVAKSKNVQMDPRGAHDKTTLKNGWTMRVVAHGENNTKLKTRFKK